MHSRTVVGGVRLWAVQVSNSARDLCSAPVLPNGAIKVPSTKGRGAGPPVLEPEGRLCTRRGRVPGARALPDRQGALGAVWMPVLRPANHRFSTDCFCLIEPDLGPVAYSELWMIHSRNVLYAGSPSSQRNLPVLERTGGDKLGSMCVGQHTSKRHREQWKRSPCGSWCRATPRTFLREMENSFSHCLQCVASSSFSHVWPCGGKTTGLAWL